MENYSNAYLIWKACEWNNSSSKLEKAKWVFWDIFISWKYFITAAIFVSHKLSQSFIQRSWPSFGPWYWSFRHGWQNTGECTTFCISSGPRYMTLSFTAKIILLCLKLSFVKELRKIVIQNSFIIFTKLASPKRMKVSYIYIVL